MNSPHSCTLERLDSNIVLTQVDDLCMLHIGKDPVGLAKTREIGERLRNYLELGLCRKLVISFEGTENIFGFVLDRTEETWTHRDKHFAACSEMWLG